MNFEVGQYYLCTGVLPTLPMCVVTEITRVVSGYLEYRFWISSGGYGTDSFLAKDSPLWHNAVPITEEQMRCLVNLWCPQYKSTKKASEV